MRLGRSVEIIGSVSISVVFLLHTMLIDPFNVTYYTIARGGSMGHTNTRTLCSTRKVWNLAYKLVQVSGQSSSRGRASAHDIALSPARFLSLASLFPPQFPTDGVAAYV